jgi:hypothetical protein
MDDDSLDEILICGTGRSLDDFQPDYHGRNNAPEVAPTSAK